MLSPDNYVQAPGQTQSYNRYTYAMNNPLVYTDPDGNFWFIIPQIGFGKSGFSLGLEVGVGVPGVLSASVTGGYNFKSQQGYWSIQGSIFGAYAGYGSSGAFFGYGYRYAGLSVGAGYGSSGWNIGISYGGTTSNFSGAAGIGWSQKGGFDWNVSGAYTDQFGTKATNTSDTQALASLQNYLQENQTFYEWDLDFDGKLSKAEADSWWIKGKGNKITVDNKNIDWTGLTIPDGKGIDDDFFISTVDAFAKLPYETAATYGGTGFVVISKSAVRVLDQLYHYDMRSWSSAGNILRNIATKMGQPRKSGTDFMIHYKNSYIRIK